MFSSSTSLRSPAGHPPGLRRSQYHPTSKEPDKARGRRKPALAALLVPILVLALCACDHRSGEDGKLAAAEVVPTLAKSSLYQLQREVPRTGRSQFVGRSSNYVLIVEEPAHESH